jgi:enoyl-[acyl-carrier protein] reductase II
VIGTRFIASTEATAAREYRDAIVHAADDSTVRTRCYTGKPARAIRNSYTSDWESRPSEIQPFPIQIMESVQRGVMDYSGRRGDADPERTFMPAGQGLGLIQEIRPAGEVFRDLVAEATAAIEGLKPLV